MIDLIFNNDTNDYYRASGKHRCEGYVGRPPSNLELNITYDNGTSFDMISNTNINLDISTMSNGCRNKEVIEFGLRFSQDMVGAKLRCGVKDSTNDFTLSEELSLIPSMYTVACCYTNKNALKKSTRKGDTINTVACYSLKYALHFIPYFYTNKSRIMCLMFLNS